jgi:dolichyl-phosphate beta-glucosyltransferase
MQKIAVIIPCFNEAKRLSPALFTDFAQLHPDIDLFFVNDASTDNTLALLQEIAASFPHRINVLNLPVNAGKGNAVRQGILTAIKRDDYSSLGYLDGDLATSLEEFNNLCQLLHDENAVLVTGCRVKLVNSHIIRSTFRHFVGRIIATIVDSRFKLGIYDTQCGAKCFRKDVTVVFQEPFKTRWLFDIEVFLRLRQKFPASLVIEKPLSQWREPGESKLNMWSFPAITKEIISLLRHYRN